MYQNEKQVIDAIKEGKLSVREADAIARGFSPAAAMRIMQAFSGVENLAALRKNRADVPRRSGPRSRHGTPGAFSPGRVFRAEASDAAFPRYVQ